MKKGMLFLIVCLFVAYNVSSQASKQYIDLNIFYLKKQADSLFSLKEYSAAFKSYRAIEKKRASSARDFYREAIAEYKLGRIKKSKKYLVKSYTAGHLYSNEYKVEADSFLREDKLFIIEFKKKVIGQTQEHIKPANPVLLDTLLVRRKKDQFYRIAANPDALQKTKDSLLTLLRKSDRENQDWLLDYVEKNGVPGYREVGYDGDNAVWLIVQHADNDTAFQKKFLVLIKEEVRKNNSNPNNYAYLVDRILINTGYSQVFGTQFIMNNDSDNISLSLKPVENEFLLDCLRNHFELPPIKDYLRMSTDYYKKKYEKKLRKE